MPVRVAVVGDVPEMLQLADRKRQQYVVHNPVFHRPAENAAAIQRPWFTQLVENDEAGVFVDVDQGGGFRGFLVATVVPAPPVYDPGGLTCSIDDFAVLDDALWPIVGLALLRSAQQWAVQRGAVQAVVVCGPHDAAKRKMLMMSGLHVVSEWFTGPAR